MHALHDSALSEKPSPPDHDGALRRALDVLAAGEAGLAPPYDAGQVGAALALLVERGVDRPPLPGAAPGATLARWRMLADVAAHDVGLVKLYEGHTDAVAILAELGAPPAPRGTRWAVWAAEPPQARLVARRGADAAGMPAPGVAEVRRAGAARTAGSVGAPDNALDLRLDGRKAWCSGAASVTHALVTAWLDDQTACLAQVALDQPGVRVTGEGWHARGMAATASVDVVFENAAATLVGAPGEYLARPGFWHGGAGIGACWYGAAAAIGRYAMARLAVRAAGGALDDLSALYAAELDLALAAAVTLLRESAAAIDAVPQAPAQALAMRVRLEIEALAERVLRAAGRALGAGPLCRDARFAALMTDLPVFLRQSHAERDLAAYGRAGIEQRTTGEQAWRL
ncbi:acyl-CoA/acyl-ACP dehydrogenase [Robbsia sp. Bb-Pol-6]|uniref:Acyl-CoA/acyl-ACP dehydrogenase n=1 Tax=Robbsia betulipollinis TaxID=2981849 RepID=A0ABT3ZLG7_9BURK|nr:acyl-CoA dehydrogenase family protein [Robbsia betulipollinis]MCY0387383.1 acyl-CoA/acyl-ACP dehydrogenase [Robbsia betulipollinis]